MATSERSNQAYEQDDIDQIYPRLSGSKQPYQQSDHDAFKTIGAPGEQRLGSGRGGAVTNDVNDQVQAYANNAIGVSGALRNKLQKLRHPSSNRRPPPIGNTMVENSMIGEALNSSTSVHTAAFDQVHVLRDQNIQLKNKMAQLNVALDKAVTDKQNVARTSRQPLLGNSHDGGEQQAELHRQREINNRLNDLLNQKDDEILEMSQKLLDLEDQVRSGSPNKKKGSIGASPMQRGSPKFPGDMKGKFGAISDLENKLIASDRQNKELQKEIKLLQRIQDRQGNALEQMNQEGFNEKQASHFMTDLRVQKEKVKQLKMQLIESEKLNKFAHANQMKLEQTIKELKAASLEQKKLQAKSKQNERIVEASDKIDELVQANQYLNQAKENAVKLSGKQRQQYARQMAALHHRIDYLTRVLQENGVELTE